MRSKMVVDRERSARSVVQAAETHAPMIGRKLAEQLQAQLQPGEKMPDFELVARLLGRHLNGSLQPLVSADEAHEAELRDDSGPRKLRDDSCTETYAMLTRVRSAVEAVHGPDGVAALGFRGTTPVDPIAVKELAKTVLNSFDKLQGLASNDGVLFDGDMFKRTLTLSAKHLEQSLDDVAREAREAEGTLTAKQRALVIYDERFSLVSSALSAMLGLAGERELAARVRPTVPRTGQNPETPADPTTPGPV